MTVFMTKILCFKCIKLLIRRVVQQINLEEKKQNPYQNDRLTLSGIVMFV